MLSDQISHYIQSTAGLIMTGSPVETLHRPSVILFVLQPPFYRNSHHISVLLLINQLSRHVAPKLHQYTETVKQQKEAQDFIINLSELHLYT